MCLFYTYNIMYIYVAVYLLCVSIMYVLHVCIHRLVLTHRKEVVLYLCCYWPEEKYCGPAGEEIH